MKELPAPSKEHPKFDKTVLLVITDGWDNVSKTSLENAIQMLQGEDSPAVYCIGILNKEDKRKHRRALQEISDSTGGVAYFPNDLNEVDTITQQVAHDIRNQYTLGFKKNPQGGTGYRAVRVEARAAGYRNLQVRTRSGYVPGSGKR
jgi:VWFA-related protein